MSTASASNTSHEERLAALEQRLLALVEDIHQLLEDMAAEAEPGGHDATRSS